MFAAPVVNAVAVGPWADEVDAMSLPEFVIFYLIHPFKISRYR
jgi:hypothetical protein